MSDQLDRLGRQLDVIGRALEIALDEPDPVARREGLTALDAAREVSRREYEAAVAERARMRAVLRVVRGGSAVALVVSLVGRLRGRQVAAWGTAAGTAALAALAVWVAPGDGSGGGDRVGGPLPSSSAEAVSPDRSAVPSGVPSVSPSRSAALGPSASPSPSSPPPASLLPDVTPLDVTLVDDGEPVPAPSVTARVSVPPGPSLPGGRGVTVPTVEPESTRCAIDLSVSLLDLRAGRLLCL